MNDIVLENFINFCDDMMITNEGFKDTKVFSLLKRGWEFIKNAVSKLFTKIANFLAEKNRKSNEVLVYSEFVKKYHDIEGKIKGTAKMDTDTKKTIYKMIDSLMEMPIKVFDKKSMKATDKRLSPFPLPVIITMKITGLNTELKKLKIAADNALKKFENSKYEYERSRQQGTVREEMENGYIYSEDKSALEDAINKLFKCELYIKLYTGVINKLSPSND